MAPKPKRKPTVRVFSRPEGTDFATRAVEITNLPPEEAKKIQEANAIEGQLRNAQAREQQTAAIQERIAAEQVTQAQKDLAASVVQPPIQAAPPVAASQTPQVPVEQPQPSTGPLAVAGRVLFGNQLETNVVTGQPNVDAQGNPIQSAAAPVPFAAAPAGAVAAFGKTASNLPGVVVKSTKAAKGALTAFGIGAGSFSVGAVSRQHVKNLQASIEGSKANMADAINAINAGGYGKPTEFWLDLYQQELSNINEQEQALQLASKFGVNFFTGASDELEKIERWRNGGQLDILNGKMQQAILQPDATRVIVTSQENLNTDNSFF